VIESVKAASDIYAPVAGEVIANNQDAVDAPERSMPTPTPPGCSSSSRPTRRRRALLDAAGYAASIA
jgi:glycine cleavage system H protein